MTDRKTLSHTFEKFEKFEKSSSSQNFDSALDELAKIFARKCARETFTQELKKHNLLNSERDIT